MNTSDDEFVKEKIQYLQERLNRCLSILGVVTSFIFEVRSIIPEEKQNQLLWIIQSIENVVYQDKAPPPFPER